jgi:FkbM family methyltransferase
MSKPAVSTPPGEAKVTAESLRVREFLADVLPFFYGRRLTYVDVGAYEGKVFQEVLAAGLEVREAHLIEPNEESLRVARENAENLSKSRTINFYHVALGSTQTRVTMRADRSMTKVTAVRKKRTAANGSDSAFEVELTGATRHSKWNVRRSIE